jgi:hypothetical protein
MPQNLRHGKVTGTFVMTYRSSQIDYETESVCPPLHLRNIPYIARYAATPQPTNEVILRFFTSAALVRNDVCSLRMVELLKHVRDD